LLADVADAAACDASELLRVALDTADAADDAALSAELDADDADDAESDAEPAAESTALCRFAIAAATTLFFTGLSDVVSSALSTVTSDADVVHVGVPLITS
jgi:hypothetical protein